MVRGQADFGLYAPKEVSASISDMGEVAARLGSIVIFDKRGEVVDFDNFESPVLRWSTSAAMGGGYVRLDSENVKSEAQSVKIYVPAFAERLSYCRRTAPVLASLSIGTEISFHMELPHLDTRLRIYYYDGETLHFAGAKIHYAGGFLSISNSVGTYIDKIPVVRPPAAEHMFQTLKLVVDFKADLYKRVMFNTKELDISDMVLETSEDEASPHIEADFTLMANTATEGDAWFDDFILTQSEP